MATLSRRKIPIFCLFAVSGSCVLVYEILWAKYLTLTFGTSIPAISTVSATFMSGLALGSYLLGRNADRRTNLLQIYAFLELAIALTALLFPPTLELLQSFYVWAVRQFPAHAFAISALRVLLAGILLLPPAVFMGGTFPLMCRYLAGKRADRFIGRLYALNTLGATFGAFLSGFVLIPFLGLSRSGWVAILGNLLIAAVALWLSRGEPASEGPAPDAGRGAGGLSLVEGRRVLLLSVALAGGCALAYEVLWTRALIQFLGNTSYAFALVLSAYLVGIALGGYLYPHLVRGGCDAGRLYRVLMALMGVSVLVSAPFYDRLAYLCQMAHTSSAGNWWLLTLLLFVLVFAVMVLPTLLSGALLPAAVVLLAPGRTRLGEGVGLVVLHNTAGAVVGSLAAGFCLLP